jgi:hypothetical protein
MRHICWPQPNSLRSIIDSAKGILTSRLDSRGEEFAFDVVNGVPGHVNGNGQYPVYTFNASTGRNTPPKHIRDQFLELIRRSPEKLIGLDTGRQLTLNEFGIDVNDDEAAANFLERCPGEVSVWMC